MAVSKTTNGGAKPASRAEPKKAPQNEPKKPQDNKAVKQAPKETKTAAKNAFGDVPKNGAKDAPKNDGAKTPTGTPKDNGAKESANAPKAPQDGAKNAPPADQPKAPAEPAKEPATPDSGAKTPAANGQPGDAAASAADGKTAPEDAKTAPANADGKTTTPIVVKTPFGNPDAPKTSNLVTGNPPVPPVDDGKAPPAGDAKAAPDPATDSKTPPADDPKTTPVTDPKATPATQQGPITATNLPVNPKMAVVDDPKAAPAADPKTAPGADAKAPLPPVDPKVQTILDTKLPDGKTVKEKIDADTPAYIVKAAQDYYNKQKESGAELDNVSKFYLNNSAKNIAENGVKQDDVSPDKLNDVFDKEQINKNLEEIAKDPAFNKWATEQQANSVQKTIEDNPDIAKLVEPYQQPGENAVNALRRMQSEYMGSQDFADGVAKAKTAEEGKALVTDGVKTLSSLGLDEKETLGVVNTLTEDIRSQYTPDAPKAVIDPNTNKTVQTEDGNNLATLPDGTGIALGTDGKAVADKQGNAYVYNEDGTAKVDANSKYVQYDAKAKVNYANYNGTKYMIGGDGNGRFDAQGRPLAVDNDGGAPVALDKDGKAVTDLTGNKLVFDPKTGKAVTDPESGNAVVIDPATKAVVQADVGGKIVAGKNGDPYAVDQNTGKFVQDAQGRYVQISKDNVAPGILPGYVVDANNTKMVVNPTDGKPMVDPATGKTVILDPKTNAPQLVPLDVNGAPKLANDGKSIVYDENGNTIVSNEGKGPNWLVDAGGNYVQNENGNYIGVGEKTGLAAPVDEKGFVKNANGLTPLWDAKANAPMKTNEGAQVAIDQRGNLLALNAQGQTIVEEKSGLPFVVDPKTKAVAVNPETGRSVLLGKGGALVEYNADDGYQYLIDPKTQTTVKTADGNPVVMSESAGVPYAVTPDGTVIRNPDTGNAIVYGTDGKPAVELSTGNPLEITASGKAHVIDPKTNAPMAQKDPKTGGYQLFNKDGSEVTNPDTGNKIQMAPGSTLKLEIDAKTGKPVEDGNGNILLIGPDNRPLKTPEGNPVVADEKSGVPIAVNGNGKTIAEPLSGLPQVVNTDTGLPVSDPVTKRPVVIDPKSGKPVQIDPKTKEPIKDPATGLNIIANGKTGEQMKGPEGEPVVVTPGTGMAVYYDKQNNTFTEYDFATGKAKIDLQTGAKTILDPGLGIPSRTLPGKDGKLYLVNDSGKVQTDNKGRPLQIDKDTGQVVVEDENGKLVDVGTGKAPEKQDMKIAAYLLPLAHVPSIFRNKLPGQGKTGAGSYPGGLPAPSDNTATDQPADPNDPFNFKTTPEDRAAIKASWDQMDWGDVLPDTYEPEVPYEYYAEKVRTLQAGDLLLAQIPEEELVVLMRYTVTSSQINAVMRYGDAAQIAQYEPAIKGIRSAANRLRDLGFGYDGELFRNLAQTPEQIEKNWKLGSTVKDPAFMSTTPDFRIADNFGNVRLKLDTGIGVDISAVSAYPEQKEVLILDNIEWEIAGEGSYKPTWRLAAYKGPLVTRDLVPASTLNGQPGTSAAAAADALANPGGSGALPNDALDIELDTFPTSAPSDITTTTAAQSTDPVLSATQTSANAGKWAKVGKAIGYAMDGLDIVGGGVQVVLGGLQIDDGIKNKNNYDIASGALNTTSGALGIAAGVLGLMANPAVAVPLAAAAFIVGTVASIVDFAGSLDDDEQFADKLNQDYGSLGILKDGWRPKAEEAHRDGFSEYYQPNYQA